MDMYIFIFEVIGTIAFAISGALTGMRKQMDIFGICVLGVTTAVGGDDKEYHFRNNSRFSSCSSRICYYSQYHFFTDISNFDQQAYSYEQESF